MRLQIRSKFSNFACSFLLAALYFSEPAMADDSARYASLPSLSSPAPGTQLLGVKANFGIDISASDDLLNPDGEDWGYSVSVSEANLLFNGAVLRGTDVTVEMIEKDWMLSLDQAFLSFDMALINPQLNRLIFSVGRQMIPFGLQSQMEGRDLLRGGTAYATALAAPGASLEGVQLEGSRDYIIWQSGIFIDPEKRLSSSEMPWLFSGRVATRNRETRGLIVQMGVSGSYKELGAESGWHLASSKISVQPFNEFLSSPYSYYSSGNQVATTDKRVGWDAMIQGKTFTVQWEAFQRKVSGETADEASELIGGYGQVSWMRNGQLRKYNDRRGLLEMPDPKGAWGSFEWFAGVEALHFKLASESNRHDLKSYFVGQNWYANKNVKVSAQWQHVSADSSYVRNQKSDGTGRGVSLGLLLMM